MNAKKIIFYSVVYCLLQYFSLLIFVPYFIIIGLISDIELKHNLILIGHIFQLYCIVTLGCNVCCYFFQKIINTIPKNRLFLVILGFSIFSLGLFVINLLFSFEQEKYICVITSFFLTFSYVLPFCFLNLFRLFLNYNKNKRFLYLILPLFIAYFCVTNKFSKKYIKEYLFLLVILFSLLSIWV
jgi:hypothetical protein